MWHETHPMFHNELLYQYRSLAQEAAGTSDESRYRRRMLEFLTQSKHYIPEQILVHFPHDGERTQGLVMGRAVWRRGFVGSVLVVPGWCCREPGLATSLLYSWVAV